MKHGQTLYSGPQPHFHCFQMSSAQLKVHSLVPRVKGLGIRVPKPSQGLDWGLLWFILGHWKLIFKVEVVRFGV